MYRLLALCCTIHQMIVTRLADADVCCCTELGHVNENLEHYLMNSATLFNHSDVYFRGNNMVNRCGIKYVDMKTIGPKKPKKWGWVTYMGDSLNRGIFYVLANQFSGWRPTEDVPLENMVAKQAGVYPLLGEVIHICSYI